MRTIRVQILAKINNTNYQKVGTSLTPDFIDEIPSKVKVIELVNNYHITNLVFPPRELMKNSKLFRYRTIREGSLERILRVDSNSFENVIEFKI